MCMNVFNLMNKLKHNKKVKMLIIKVKMLMLLCKILVEDVENKIFPKKLLK